MSERCLLIGGAGFIGRALADALVRDGKNVRIFTRTVSPDLRKSFSGWSTGKVELLQGDFLVTDDLRRALDGCDSIVHLVTTTLPATSNADKVLDIETNLLATVRLLEVARSYGPKRIVFLSSGGTVYGNPLYIPIDEVHPTNPLSSYGIGKLAIEKYLNLYSHLYGFNAVSLRLSNPYGPGQRGDRQQGAVAVFLERALTGKSIDIWGDGKVVRDYVYIDDAVNAICTALQYKGTQNVFNIGSGEGHDLNEIINVLGRLLNRKLAVSYHDPRAVDVKASILDISLAQKHLGWTPRFTFDEGISRFLQSRAKQLDYLLPVRFALDAEHTDE